MFGFNFDFEFDYEEEYSDDNDWEDIDVQAYSGIIPEETMDRINQQEDSHPYIVSDDW